MKILVFVPQNIASESHREKEEEVDVDIQDTVAEIKIKVTMVYEQLDPEEFSLYLQQRRLRN